MDPNWFYSTLAQSTAAIVGLAGGFLVQRLLTQRSEVGQQRADLRARCQALLHEMVAAKERAAAVGQAMDFALEEAPRMRKTGHEKFTLHSAFLFTFTHGKGYGDMVPEVEFEEAEQLKAVRDTAWDYWAALPNDLPGLLDGLNSGGVMPLGGPAERGIEPSDIEPSNFWRWVPFQRQFVVRESEHFFEKSLAVAKELEQFRARLVPASMWVLLGILGGLLVTGVILPLFFLSARDGVSKPFLLALFMPLALAFFGYAAYELARIRAAADLAREHF